METSPIKKLRKYIFYTILFFVVLLFRLCPATPQKRVSAALNITLPRGTEVLIFIDTHSGFHGDGTTYAELRLPAAQAEPFLSKLAESPDWHPLPLSDDAQIAFFGQTYFENDISVTRKPVVPEGVTISCPAEALWYLRDRQTGQNGSVFSGMRHSLNFTAALLDTTAQTLYFLQIDT